MGVLNTWLERVKSIQLEIISRGSNDGSSTSFSIGKVHIIFPFFYEAVIKW